MVRSEDETPTPLGALLAHSSSWLVITPCISPGELLAKLPLDPRLGKLILLGSCFDVLDEALTIAAALP